MTRIEPSHVAILVPSVRRAAEALSGRDLEIGPEENFEGEGTKEIYVEGGRGNSLLLLEPTKPGPYQRALKKRGPGLHHMAIDVENLESFLGSLGGSRWLLHPVSVQSMRRSRTAYLARPGFPGLIEVQEKKELETRPLFIEKVTLDFDRELLPLAGNVGLASVVEIGAPSSLTIGGRRIQISTLFE